MNILELDSFNLADAVKFNDQLNPRIWSGNKMRPEVREKLLEIAADFKEFLGLSDLDVKDITVSGSNAAYTYTPQSDIDLHLVVDIPRADQDEVYRELFDAKKYQYNDLHNIKIGGYDVELYVENANKPPVSKGVFSVLNNDWISIPRQRKATVDDDSVRSKYEDLKHRIEDAVKSNDAERIDVLARKIKAYRQAGLDRHGELGSENLAYKMLRNQGYIEKLYQARSAARDAELSLAEQNKERKPFVYGFKTVEEDVTLTPDGVSASTRMFLSEKPIPSHTEIIFDFMRFVVHELDLHNVPKLKIHKDPQWSVIHKSFGRYRDDIAQIDLAAGNRHIMDVLRTLAHELQHRKQDEREHMPPGAGKTGSRFENEAHAVAGILMRKYADLHPEYFEDVPVNEASGYIPTRAQANDARFKMALTQDIKPGQTGKEANKLALNTDAQGQPALLMKTANLRESHEEISEIDRRGMLKALGAGGLAAAVPGVAQADYFVDVLDLAKSDPKQFEKIWIPRYQELSRRCQAMLQKLISAAGPQWAQRLNGITIKVVSSKAYAQASSTNRQILIDLSVFWDAPDDALAFSIAHELGHIALDHTSANDQPADYETQVKTAKKYRQDELDADSFAIRLCKALGYSKAEVFKFINKNEEEYRQLELMTQSPTSHHPSFKTRIDRAKANGFELSRGGIEQMNALKQHLAEDDDRNKSRMPQTGQAKSRYKDLNQPLGPETKPTMPAGTVRVDVSDMYDWYKLGQHISNMKGLGRHDFGAGPPSSIISFGDEETEHKFIKDLQATGLDITDIDPADPNQPPGMKKIKTDPTYNVDEGRVYNIAPDQLIDVFYNPGRIDKAADVVKVATIPYKNLDKLVALLGQKHKIKPVHIFWSPVKKQQQDPNKGVDENELVESLRQEFSLLEDEVLGEIKMSTSSLRQEAAKTGALAGMEFEMIVPNVGSLDGSETNYEPDWDADERTKSFDNIEEFFYDGDWNSRSDVARMLEKLDEAYQEWQYEQITDAWESEGLEYIKDYIDNNNEFDRDSALDTARDEFMDANPDIPVESEEAQKIISARVEELEEEFAEETFNEGIRGSNNRIYDYAFEEFSDEKRSEFEESEFLRDTYPRMTDIESNFDIQWPHYIDTNEDQQGADIESVAQDFGDSIGRPVNASSDYHRGLREPGKYVVEPDGSLRGDDEDDAGLEFVSPPLPIDELLSDLNKVKTWAKRRGCYTNNSTGLHINVSVPNFDNAKLDYVKLALLLGDEYVLDQYGRSSNTYTKSAMGIIKDKIRQNPETAQAMLEKMRGHMEDLASKAIHSGQTSKYTSINTKDGYIEFRSPGGDWLDANFDKIENTLLRFTVALSAAMDPDAYREEYLKKLYKLLEPSAQDKSQGDTIKFFADYVAGKLPKAALRSFIKQAQLQRKISKDTSSDTLYWWEVEWDANRKIEVVATSADVAKQVAAEEWGVPESRLAGAKVTVLRPYKGAAAKTPATSNRPSNPDGNYVIVNNHSRGVPYYRFMAAGDDDADTVLMQWSRENPGEWLVRYDPHQQMGQPPVPASTMDLQRRRDAQSAGEFQLELSQTDMENRLGLSDQTGDANYEIVNTNTMQPVFVFIANSDQEAANKYQDWVEASGLPDDNYAWREISRRPGPGSTQDRINQQADAASTTTPASNQLWSLRLANGQEVHRFWNRNDRDEAGRYAANWLRNNGMGVSGEGFSIEPVSDDGQQLQGSDPGSLIDQGLAASGTFTGNWLIQDENGRTIHRFGGIGNSQGDANSFAMRWLRQNPRYMQAGVTVSPEMS